MTVTAVSVVGAACSSHDQTVSSPTQDSDRASSPSAGLPEGSSGSLVVGDPTYWFGVAVGEHGPNDNADLKRSLSRPLNVAKRFDERTQKWDELPPLPGDPTAVFQSGTVTGGFVVVVSRLCEDATIDLNESDGFECTATQVSVLGEEANSWSTTSFTALTGAPDPTVQGVVPQIRAVGTRALLETSGDEGASQWLVDPKDMSRVMRVEPAPPALATPFGIGDGCSSPDGLTVVGPVFQTANGDIVGPSAAGITGSGDLSADGTVPAGTAVARLSPDGSWTSARVVPNYVALSPLLGCTDGDVAFRARDIGSAAGGLESQRMTAISLSFDGQAREVPQLVGNLGPPNHDLRFTGQAPTVDNGRSIASYNSEGHVVCSAVIPGESGVLYPLPSRNLFQERTSFSDLETTYELLECTA